MSDSLPNEINDFASIWPNFPFAKNNPFDDRFQERMLKIINFVLQQKSRRKLLPDELKCDIVLRDVIGKLVGAFKYYYNA